MEQQADGTYNKYQLANVTTDINYEIRAVARDIKTSRLMQQLIHEVFGMMKYITMIDGTYRLITFVGQNDLTGSNILEYIWMYQIKDVLIGEPILLESGIKKIEKSRQENCYLAFLFYICYMWLKLGD